MRALQFSDPVELYRVLKHAWSEETCCSDFRASNPSRNQCSVTALAVQRFFGGEIVKTLTAGGTHFYNLIEGTYWDLSAEQFHEPIPYRNEESSTMEALADTSEAKLAALLHNIGEQVELRRSAGIGTG